MEERVIEGVGNIPKVGQTVYVIYGNGLYKETVKFIGKKSFITEAIKDVIAGRYRPDFCEWDYEDKDCEWFTDLQEGKDEILSRFDDDYELVEYEKTFWEMERL